MKKFVFTMIALALMVSAQAQYTTIFSEDFESYANNAALTAAWGTNTITGLSTDQAVSGTQSAADLTCTVLGALTKTSGITPVDTAVTPVTVTFWMYDSSGAGLGCTGSATLNGRSSLSFGRAAGDYISIGSYHANSTTHYVSRVVSGTPGGYIVTTAPRTVGWQKFKMVLDNGTVNIYHNDGPTPILTTQYTNKDNWGAFVRFGSLAGGPYVNAYYDDLLIQSGYPPFDGVYTWSGGLNGDYTVPGNWTPARTTPATTDTLVIDTPTTITNVQTQTIAGFEISGGAEVNFQSPGAARTLTISGGADSLLIDAGASLRLRGTHGFALILPSGTTGEIRGDVIMQQTAAGAAANRNEFGVATAGGLLIKSGATIAMAPHTSGAGGGFLGTGAVDGGVIFESGSHYYQGGEKDGTFNGGTGSNPFGLSAPASAVVFNTGSFYTNWAAIPATSGRTYASFIWREGVTGRSLGGGSPLVMLDDFIHRNSLTATQGTLTISAQTGNWTIGRDLILESDAAALVYNPSLSAAREWTIGGNVDVQDPAKFTPPTNANLTVVHNGATLKTIDWAGKALPNMNVNALGGLSLDGAVTVSGLLTLTTGTVTTNGNAFTATNISRPANGGYVIGALTRPINATVTGNRLFPVGTNPYSPVEVDITVAGTGTGSIAASATAGDHPSIGAVSEAIDRYWTLTPTGISGFTATLVFNYLDADVTGTAVEADLVAASWNGSSWTFYPGTVIDTVNNTATVAGVTSLSDWVLINEPQTDVADWQLHQ